MANRDNKDAQLIEQTTYCTSGQKRKIKKVTQKEQVEKNDESES